MYNDRILYVELQILLNYGFNLNFKVWVNNVLGLEENPNYPLISLIKIKKCFSIIFI